MENVEWMKENVECRMENGEWRVDKGEWKKGERRMENGQMVNGQRAPLGNATWLTPHDQRKKKTMPNS